MLLFLPAIIIFVLILFAVYDHLLNEDRDYALNSELLLLAHQLDVYKKQHGVYPPRILAIRKSDSLCVTYMYQKCQKVYYRPINNNQNFHIALHSFTWVLLWYKSGFCGKSFFFCAASPERTKIGTDTSFPIYRRYRKIFDNPNEWPVL